MPCHLRCHLGNRSHIKNTSKWRSAKFIVAVNSPLQERCQVKGSAKGKTCKLMKIQKPPTSGIDINHSSSLYVIKFFTANKKSIFPTIYNSTPMIKPQTRY
uniref:Uncharacterized protein n=1 Tax=Opuntia streptacantha TaxID=393608 RepID=A0A7C9DC50_OPUST